MATPPRINQVFVPSLSKHVYLQDRDAMKKGRPLRSARLTRGLPPATLPIDWTKTDTLDFPMDGNDQYGDCMMAAACHADNTFTGCAAPPQSVFDVQALIKQYLALAGGDNGLDEGTLISGWRLGLAGQPDANILDAIDIDPNNSALTQAFLENFGSIVFMFAVPNAWIDNFATGVVWDAPATANPSNGHGVIFNGCDSRGYYKLQTWGSHVWITPKGVAVSDPSAFAVFSKRWFNAQGVAPNGKTYDELGALWVQSGGHSLPPWTPGPGPGPTPTPTPPAPIQQQVDAIFAALIKQYARQPRVVAMLKLVQKMVDGYLRQHPGFALEAVMPEVCSLVDAIFSMAASLHPDHGTELKGIQTIVDAMLSMVG